MFNLRTGIYFLVVALFFIALGFYVCIVEAMLDTFWMFPVWGFLYFACWRFEMGLEAFIKKIK